MLISINLHNKSSEISTSEVLTREASLDNRGPDKKGSTVHKLDNNQRGLTIYKFLADLKEKPIQNLVQSQKNQPVYNASSL